MTRRTRRRSWGSITEITRGKKYVLRWTQNTPKGRKRLTKTVYGTYAQANLELDRIHVKHAQDSPTPTVRQAWELWALPTMQARIENQTITPRSVDQYAVWWRVHVEPRWGDTPVDALRAVDLQEWLLTLTKSQARGAYKVLRKIYSHVAAVVPLPLDPFAASIRYTMPTRTERARTKGVYDLKEAREVFATLKGNPLEPVFILTCFASCRVGEALGAKLSDIELFSNDEPALVAIDICRQMSHAGTEPLPDGQLKTAASERTVIVLPDFNERLLEIIKERRAFGTEWLCDRGDGTPLNVDICNIRWRKYCESNSIRYIPLQNLRNSWRTICEVELRLPWDLLETLMGHRLPGVSGAHYIRPSKEQLVCAVRDSFRIS